MSVAVAYEADTIVLDPGEQEGVTMQIFANGTWHRRLPDLSATACGVAFHSQFAPARRETLQHPLCPGCFTPIELARADKDELQRFEP